MRGTLLAAFALLALSPVAAHGAKYQFGLTFAPPAEDPVIAGKMSFQSAQPGTRAFRIER